MNDGKTLFLKATVLRGRGYAFVCRFVRSGRLVLLVIDDLVNYYLKQCSQLVPLVLLLFEFVEESGKRFRPALVHLDHLRLNVEKHAIDVVQILLCES